ncbi:hypothetical protein diail_5732 [Diaporthe ilicicola]|nr:hypothetical protein diail_5732 [Diaporthe ilicicola]
MYLSQLITALLSIITVTSGHGIMIEPRPYNLETEPLQQVAPLSAELPFPCQGRTQHVESRTVLTAGTNQTVQFWISAVHGGGSCQFSVTYDYPPPADPSRWKTLYTVIGDCPAQAAGNLETVEKDKAGRENGVQCVNGDSGSECVRQYNIPIPSGLENSDNATFAWSWLNRIGNREFYMSCAPVKIVGGTGDKQFMDSLPPVFTANIPGSCTTGESGQLFNIPNPGKYGRVYAEPGPSGAGQCPVAEIPTFVVEDPQNSVPPTSVSKSPSSFVTVTTSTRTVTSKRPSSSGSTTTSTTRTATSGANPTDTSQPPWAYGQVRCDAADGTIQCFEENTFGLCNKGWAEPMPLNADQICLDGQITYKLSSTSSVSAF